MKTHFADLKSSDLQTTSFTSNNFLDGNPEQIAPYLSRMKAKELLGQLERLVTCERKMTHIILWHILEVENRKLFFELGYNSLYQYLNQHLGYAEGPAYERMQAARLLRKVPEVTEKIKNGEVNLSQLVQIEKGIKDEKKRGYLQDHVEEKRTTLELIQQVQNKNLHETKQIVARALDLPLQTAQKTKPQKDESVRVEVTFTKAQFELLKEAQSIMSHSVPSQNIAEAITYLTKKFVEQKRGTNINRRKPDQTQGADCSEEKPAEESPSPTRSQNRKHIPVEIQRAVFTRANHCCEFTNPKTKTKCRSKHQLQIDHRVPWSISHDDSIENLRILCAAHNRSESRRWGLAK